MKFMRKDQEGQGLLEFTMIFLILMLVMFGIIGFSLIFNAHLNLNLAVNAAARVGAVIEYTDPIYPEYYDEPMYDELVGSLVLLDQDNIVDITIFDGDEAGGAVGTHRDILDGDGNHISNNFPRSLRTRESGDAAIGVQVRYNQPIIVPLLSAITGEEILIVRSAVVRLE